MTAELVHYDGTHGGWIVVSEDAAPCYNNPDFLPYVDVAGTERFQGPNREALERAHYVRMEEEIAPTCGSCPIRDLCLERGIRDKWTGPAGGKWLTNGRLALPGVRAVA